LAVTPHDLEPGDFPEIVTPLWPSRRTISSRVISRTPSVCNTVRSMARRMRRSVPRLPSSSSQVMPASTLRNQSSVNDRSRVTTFWAMALDARL